MLAWDIFLFCGGGIFKWMIIFSFENMVLKSPSGIRGSYLLLLFFIQIIATDSVGQGKNNFDSLRAQSSF